jgi:O-antigen ligase
MGDRLAAMSVVASRFDLPSPSVLAAAAVAVVLATIMTVVVGPLAIALLVGGAAALYATVRMPGVIYAAYLLLAFYKGGVQPYSPIDVTVILAALNIVQVVPLLRDRERGAVSRTGLAAFGLFSLLVLAGILWAPDQSLAVDRTIRWWTLVFPPILIGGIRTGSHERYLRQFLWTFFIVASFVAVLGMTQLSNVDRLVVLNANTIQVARAALLVPLLGVAYVLTSRIGLAKASLVVLVPAGLIVAVASGSRGPLLFFVVVTVIGLAALIPKVRRVPPQRSLTIAALCLASVVGLATVASQLPSTALDRFTLLGDFIQNGLSGELTTTVGDTSAGNRVALFEVAATMFAEHPVLGVGTSGFEALSPRLLSPDEVEAWPHNSVLQVAAEFGVVGLTLFLIMIGLALFRTLPYGNAGTALRLTFVFFLFNTLVSGDIMSDRETWGLMMLLLFLARPMTEAAVERGVRSTTAMIGRPATVPLAGR